MNVPQLTTQGTILLTTFFYVLLVNEVTSTTQNNTSTFNFFRDVKPTSYKGPRRIFGGAIALISEFPQCCLLTNYHQQPICTGTIITPRFVVTAAHCIQPDLNYIFYNHRVPKRGDFAKVSRIYQHPGFEYEMVNRDRGSDIVQLYHDIGLVESQDNMHIDLTRSQHKYSFQGLDFDRIVHSDVKVLGFGNRQHSGELLSVNLHVFECHRTTWQHCACAVARNGTAKGVCVGDSGGPVIHDGVLVGVISLGPPGCTNNNDPDMIYITVFTMVSNYADIINNTVNHEANGMTELPVLIPYSGKSSATLIQTHNNVSFNIIIWMILLICLKIME